MVIIRLRGGLGNQIFQYAAARGLSHDRIIFDLFSFQRNKFDTNTFTARSFDLNFLIKNQITTLSYFPQFIVRLIFFLNRVAGFNWGRDKHNPDNIILTIPFFGITIIDGYFQSERYFLNIKKDLLSDFEFPLLDDHNNRIKMKILDSVDAVSIHVRRGDYFKPNVEKILGVLPLDYYQRAIEEIEKSIKKPTYYIFSDDPEYCNQNFKKFLNDFILINSNSGADAWKDLCLMTLCKHHIIANSSFSWWGAWLGKVDGITIAPARWFNDKTASMRMKDIVPDSWVRL